MLVRGIFPFRMLHMNSFAFLSVLLIVVKLAGTVQGLNGNEGGLNGTMGNSCFIISTQQEGICTKKKLCVKPCAARDIEFEKEGCPQTKGMMPMVCCPKPRAKPTRISAEKCLEYKELACNIEKMGRTSVKLSNCASKSWRVIIGGEEAEEREFPHMALVGWAKGDEKYFGCGGTLISNEFVLSAAHCFNHSDYGPLAYVRLGVHDTTNEAGHIDRNVSELIKYRHYNSSYEYNDIGLIRLDRVVEFNDAIRPLCLPEEPFSTDTINATATGWGYVEGTQQSNVLMKVELELFDDTRCSNDKPPSFKMPRGIRKETQFCAGSNVLTNNTCGGDSGGPLQIVHKHHYCTYTIIGVTSFGGKCNSFVNKSLGVYTRVYPYLSWIEREVWPNETEIK